MARGGLLEEGMAAVGGVYMAFDGMFGWRLCDYRLALVG